ncbi:MAG TPA: dTMP kinase [Chloroflexota bacterium]|nr:dTMP kinase [Chloroflexota bacterium]
MPLFLTFEGPDGSGKSTQARLLADELRARGHDVLLTREPGGTPLGEQLREVLLAHGGAPMTPTAMALIMSAARAQLVHDVIKPALRSDRIVILDRYADSTSAYQGAGLGLDREIVDRLRAIAAPVRPDLTFYVDVPEEIALGRLSDRNDANRLDVETVAFHRRVREGYEQLIAEEPDRWVRIDGTGTPDRVHVTIMQALAPVLRQTPKAS